MRTGKNRIKKIAAFAAAIAVMACSMTACSDKDKKNNSNTDTSAADGSSVSSADGNGGGQSGSGQAQQVVSDKVKDKDLDASFDDPDAIIALSGSSAEIRGSGAALQNGEIVISKKGIYIFSGSFDGRIVVNADEKADVKIVLNGVEITSADSCAIYAQVADKVIITLPEGSSNTLSDASGYTDSGEDSPSACVYAACDLTINGTGSLTVNGNYNNGIATKDDLVLVSGDVTVNAANNGMKGKDSITVCDGSFFVTSGGDGIKSDNSSDTEKGWIVINGGSFDITSGGDGIQAETALSITAGTVKINTQDGMGDDDSAKKGIKAGSDIYISGGSFELTTEETCVKTSGKLTVNGGSFTLSAADGKGLAGEGDVTVNGGDINVTRSEEGIESKAVLTVNGGDIRINASDDGINAGNSSDSFQGTHEIYINGGYLYINAGGDGIDSNGDITITGGTTIVAGPTNNGDGPLDCGDWGNTITVSGGILVAAGSTGMMEVPDSTSTQCSIYTTMLDASQGETVTLADDDGNVIVSVKVPKQAQGIVISSPDITSGSSYSLYKGGTLSASANGDGVVLEGSISGGELVASGEITETVTSFGGSVIGGFGGGGMGGQGGFGGGRGDKGGKGDFAGGNMPENFEGQPPDGIELPEDFGELPDDFDDDFKGGFGKGGQGGMKPDEMPNRGNMM